MLISDGGGKVIAAPRPIQTRDGVARFLLSSFEGTVAYYWGSLHTEFISLNGEIGIVLRSGDETVATVFLQTRHGKLARIYIVRNPDKLVRV